MKLNSISSLSATALFGLLVVVQQASAAIALDRTRVIFDGGNKSMSLTISNQNKQLPYLAQGWLEDEQGTKLTSPLIVLPPVQRVEPGAESQVKIQTLAAARALPQDRESLYYFNLREIPPRSDKPNSLQIALQTRIKLFYRPESIVPSKTDMATPWQEKLTLSRQGDQFKVKNPTPYYITLVDAMSGLKANSVAGFKPLMVAPKAEALLDGSASALGNTPVLTYVNDYGGRPQLTFSCKGAECQVIPHKEKD